MATRPTTRKPKTGPTAHKVRVPARRRPAKLKAGAMSVREAGRKGGLVGGRKGGLTVRAQRGIEFFQEIGRMGGRRVKDLIAAGRKATERPVRRRHT